MNATPSIWVVDDDRSIRWVLEKALHQAGMEVATFNNADGLLERLARSRPDALITDVRMPGMDGMTLLDKIHHRYAQLPVIIMTAHSGLDAAVSAYQGGAFEYLPKPFDIDEAVSLVRRAVDHARRGNNVTQQDVQQKNPDIIGEAPAMQEVFRAIGRLSKSTITVLINGESGTGKELVARALHRHSPRANKAFIAINTAAIPHDLLESELFGHERGAFTGAQAQRRGRFEQADGGTLFLDEIGDMPADLQTRLLRVLSTGEFYRVGGVEPVKVDVRIIAATHQNLETRVKEGRFREDLFHRLNVIRINLPALRERREDVPVLMRHYLRRAAEELGVEAKRLRADTVDYLSNLPWPGNVRQLENTARWLTVMASGREIVIDDLPQELRESLSPEDAAQGGWEDALQRWAESKLNQGADGILDSATPVFERIMIEAAMRRAGGHRQDAAKLLGWGRNTLTRKIKELGMEGRFAS